MPTWTTQDLAEAFEKAWDIQNPSHTPKLNDRNMSVKFSTPDFEHLKSLLKDQKWYFWGYNLIQDETQKLNTLDFLLEDGSHLTSLEI